MEISVVCSLRRRYLISTGTWSPSDWWLLEMGVGSSSAVSRGILTANNLGEIMVVMLMEMMMVLGDNGDEDDHDAVKYCH